MTDKRTHIVNDHGLAFRGAANERFKQLMIYVESSSVQVWAQIDDVTAMQYLTPVEAMTFAKAFKRCAILALKNSVE